MTALAVAGSISMNVLIAACWLLWGRAIRKAKAAMNEDAKPMSLEEASDGLNAAVQDLKNQRKARAGLLSQYKMEKLRLKRKSSTGIMTDDTPLLNQLRDQIIVARKRSLALKARVSHFDQLFCEAQRRSNDKVSQAHDALRKMPVLNWQLNKLDTSFLLNSIYKVPKPGKNKTSPIMSNSEIEHWLGLQALPDDTGAEAHPFSASGPTTGTAAYPQTAADGDEPEAHAQPQQDVPQSPESPASTSSWEFAGCSEDES